MIAHSHERCASHPHNDGPLDANQHECMRDERRCVYCGVQLHPYPCNGCGKFMTALEMHENESRCDECM